MFAPLSSRNGLVRCARCSKSIRWTLTVAGKRQPIDPEPHAAGNIAAYRDGLGTWRCRVLREGERPAHLERRYMTHFATCQPASEQLPLPIPPLLLPPGVASLDVARRRRRNHPGGTP